MTSRKVRSRPVDEHNVKSAPRSWLSEIARRLGFAYHDMLWSVTELTTFCGAPSLPGHLSVVLAGDPEIHELAGSLTHRARYWFEQARRWKSQCYVIKHEDRSAGYVWINPHVAIHQGIRLIDLPPAWAFVHDTYVLPGFRDQGLYSILVREAYLDLKRRGTCWVAALVERRNAHARVVQKSFSVDRHPAPILMLPGLRPLVFGEGFRRFREAAAKPTGA